MGSEKLKGVLAQILTYAVATAVAIYTGSFFDDWHLILQILFADIAGTVVIFIFSLIFKNSSLYDPYWSYAPAIIVGYFFFLPLMESANPTRMLVVFLLVQYWSWRLTLNFLRGWKGLSQQDWRYDDLKKKTGKWFHLVDFFGIELFPTLLVFGGCLPLFWIYQSDAAFGWLDIVATIVTFGAVTIELTADEQLRAFMRRKKPGETLTSGLWAYSRHPNYFGEMSFWWGLVLFGIAAAPEAWYYYIGGAVAITALFVFISVPMIDKRSLERRANYKEIMDSISGIIPWIPKKRF